MIRVYSSGMSAPAISVSNLTKIYGDQVCVSHATFDVPLGSVCGFVGPNGAGKTTTIRMLLGLIAPSEGVGTVLGEDIRNPSKYLRRVGAMIEGPAFYPMLSGKENLRVFADLGGISQDRVDFLLRMVGLSERGESKFKTYSLGMKQRLAIASCLLGDPDVLILDEPTNGLDPVGIAEVRELIKQLRQQGKTIIMASHMLDEVEKVCTHVAILKRGDLIVSGKVDEILAHDEIVEIGSDNLELLVNAAAQVPGCKRATLSEGLVQLYFATGTSQLSAINQYFFSQQIVLNHLQLKKKSLESKFFELTNA